MGIYSDAMAGTNTEGAARRRLLVWPGTQVGGLGRPTVPLIARDVRIRARRGAGRERAARGRVGGEQAADGGWRMADEMATLLTAMQAGWVAGGC